jgi:5-methylcytosine-specific restriction protein A
MQLAKDPWCAECMREGIYMAATEVDHIVPHRGDPIKFYTNELQSLCHICHSRKTANEIGMGRGGKNVLNQGAASGWVHSHEKNSPIEALNR